MKLSTPAAAHQIYRAHLARKLNAFEENFPDESWPKENKTLFDKALELAQNPPNEKKIKKLENRFEKLIHKNQSKAPDKIPAFWKGMKMHKDKVFTFLHNPDVPPDNNGSESSLECQSKTKGVRVIQTRRWSKNVRYY